MKHRKLVIQFVIDMESKFIPGVKRSEQRLKDFARFATGNMKGTGKGGIFGNMAKSYENIFKKDFVPKIPEIKPPNPKPTLTWIEKIKQNFNNMFESTASSSRAGSAISQLTKGLKGMLPIIAGVTVAAGLMWGAFQAGQKAETTLTSLAVMTKSMSTAKSIYMDVVKFTAKTPLLSEQTAPAAKQLLAVKWSADQLIPTMKMIGDVAAGSGKNFNELISIMAKNKSSGIIQGEDLNQLIDAGIPILDEFSKMFGKTGIEIRKMASQSKISFADLEQAFKNMTSAGGIYENMMEKQSKTVAGLLSTIKDNVSLIFTYMSGVLEPETDTTMWTYLRDVLDNIGGKISSFVETTKGFWVDLGELFGGIIKHISNIADIALTILKPVFMAIGIILWGAVKALNTMLWIADKIFGVMFRVGQKVSEWVDKIFGISDKMKLFVNQLKAAWTITGLYIDIQIKKLENWFARGGRLRRGFGRILGFDIEEPEKGKPEKQQTINKKLDEEPEWAKRRIEKLKKERESLNNTNINNRSSNVDNRRQTTNINNVNVFQATKEDVADTATRLTGQPNIVPAN